MNSTKVHLNKGIYLPNQSLDCKQHDPYLTLVAVSFGRLLSFALDGKEGE